VKRDEFEKKHPSKKTEQAINHAAWNAPAKGTNAFMEEAKAKAQSKPAVKESEPVVAAVEPVVDVDESVKPSEESEPSMEFDFEGQLDEYQREQLEELRARRARRDIPPTS
jgi:hypothetical protein